MLISSAFDGVCWTLAALYIVLGFIAAIQLARLKFRDEGSITFTSCVAPSTFQQQVHTLIFLICAVRVSFLILAVYSWNPEDGEVDANKVAFYSLDEFATVLFFSVTSVLALFWADLYYISIENTETYHTVVRPLTYGVNIIALIGVSICCYYVSQTYAEDVNYVFLQFTIVTATVYFLAALMFVYYAYAAASEIKEIPIELTARKNRLRLLLCLGFICISALVIKASLIIYFTGKSLETTTAAALAAMFFFYFFLEYFPLFIVLVFYRIDSNSENSDSENENDINESTPLGNSYKKTPRSTSPLRNTPKYADGTAPDEIVTAMIARLSNSFETPISSMKR